MPLPGYLRNACEEIDADFFSGDLLYREEDLAEVQFYLDRWSRAIAKRKKDLTNTTPSGTRSP